MWQAAFLLDFTAAVGVAGVQTVVVAERGGLLAVTVLQ